MNKTKYIVVMLLSLVPPLAFILLFVFEPLLYRVGFDRRIVAEMSDAVRIVSAVAVLAMVVYFVVHLRSLSSGRTGSARCCLLRWAWRP